MNTKAEKEAVANYISETMEQYLPGYALETRCAQRPRCEFPCEACRDQVEAEITTMLPTVRDALLAAMRRLKRPN